MPPSRKLAEGLSEQESRVIGAFARHYGVSFRRPDLLKLALTHRSYLSVTGQGPRESNERLEFLGDSVLGLVTSESLYRAHPNEHEGQLTKTKSLLVSKAILSRRALAMGLGRFVLMSHSEVESGGRQRMSILADAFESVVGAIYLDQGFEAARAFIERWLLKDSREIVADKRHTNYKSHLQEFVQSTFRTHPVYRIRSQIGPDHSKQFNVDVMVSRRVLGTGQGRNKKEAEQAAARNALEQVEGTREARRTVTATRASSVEEAPDDRRRQRARRGGRPRGDVATGVSEVPTLGEPPEATPARRPPPAARARRTVPEPRHEVREPEELEPRPRSLDEYEYEEVGRPEGPLEERHIDPYATLEDEDSADVGPRSGVDDVELPGSRSEDRPAAESIETEPEALGEESRSEPRTKESGIPYGRRSGRSKRPSRPS